MNKESKTSSSDYRDRRKDMIYYKYLRLLLTMICRKEDSFCDVGSNGTDMCSFLPCKSKKSVDLVNPYSDSETEGIKADYLEWETDRLDVITCFQVLEHIDDERVTVFANKLLKDARICVVSVPFMWREDQCKNHLQDPIDVDKLISWFGKNPVFLHCITEPRYPLSRLIAVFIDGVDPEIDLDYWRRTADTIVEEFEEYKKKKYEEKSKNKKQKKSQPVLKQVLNSIKNRIKGVLRNR